MRSLELNNSNHYLPDNFFIKVSWKITSASRLKDLC